MPPRRAGEPDPEIGNIRSLLQRSVELENILEAAGLPPNLQRSDAMNYLSDHGYFRDGCEKLLPLLDKLENIPKAVVERVRNYNTAFRQDAGLPPNPIQLGALSRPFERSDAGVSVVGSSDVSFSAPATLAIAGAPAGAGAYLSNSSCSPCAAEETDPGYQGAHLSSINTKFLDDVEDSRRKKPLLVVINETELAETLQAMSKNDVFEAQVVGYIVYFGDLDGTAVSVARFGVGVDSLNGLMLGLPKVCDELKPSCIINVGVAFGKGGKQRLGDVLVSRFVICYDQNERHGVAGNDFRGAKHEVSQEALAAAQGAQVGWLKKRSDESRCEVHVGPLLSGQALVDNPQFKAELLTRHSEAIGGEMEGQGISSVALHRYVPWIVIKGICDWGDGTKNKVWQPFAAHVAVSFVTQVVKRMKRLGVPSIRKPEM
eukprot:m.13097 g.13097  ORF g.13097 m.13097 type:complete len:430 (+) comp6749_c0_seq1:47-1336(+)